MNADMELAIRTQSTTWDVPRMVLFDDDPFFVRMMMQCARQNRISLTGVWRMDEIPLIAQKDFDLAIIDFDLGDINGLDLAEFLDEVFDQMPSIMISYSQRNPDGSHPWPRSIQNFILKENGPYKILDAAIRVHAAAERLRSSRTGDSIHI